jgi:putative restriction endonuclease
MRFWWVNHNQTFKQEIGGDYIWSPIRKKDGKFNQTYLNLTLTNIDDLVFSYADTFIKYIGVVTANCENAVVPKEFGITGNQWDKNGYLVKIKWKKLDVPFKPKNYIDQLKKLLPSKYSPIQKSGNGNQCVYLAKIDQDFANKLIELITIENQNIKPYLIEIKKGAESIDNQKSKISKAYLLPPDDANEVNDDIGEYSSSGQDEREKVKKEIKARRGQKKFRNDLRRRYANKCVITGCEILDILEAAHINPYRGKSDNHPANGLLLRSDIHTLFDLNLIGIQPKTFQVYVQERIKSDYANIHLQKLLVKENALPDKAALEARWKDFQSKKELGN